MNLQRGKKCLCSDAIRAVLLAMHVEMHRFASFERGDISGSAVATSIIKGLVSTGVAADSYSRPSCSMMHRMGACTRARTMRTVGNHGGSVVVDW
jgi:hypothetical protein